MLIFECDVALVPHTVIMMFFPLGRMLPSSHVEAVDVHVPKFCSPRKVVTGPLTSMGPLVATRLELSAALPECDCFVSCTLGWYFTHFCCPNPFLVCTLGYTPWD